MKTIFPTTEKEWANIGKYMMVTGMNFGEAMRFLLKNE